jgi:hypothetical protein
MGNTNTKKRDKTSTGVKVDSESDVPMLETGSMTFAYNMLSMKIKNIQDTSERIPHWKKYLDDVSKEDVRSKLLVNDFPSTLGTVSNYIIE